MGENNISTSAKAAVYKRFWIWWRNLFDDAPTWMFSAEPELPSRPNSTEADRSRRDYKSVHEEKSNHHSIRSEYYESISKTIRRTFLTLIGTCLFCVITLAGTPDDKSFLSAATVKLPILNYDISFVAFLLVGPAILIALWIYLQLFIAQQRSLPLQKDNTQATLPDLEGCSPRLATQLIFYWMVPVSLAVFAWDAWPKGTIGRLLLLLTFLVTIVSGILQIRRSRRLSRPWQVPLILVAVAAFFAVVHHITSARTLFLHKAELSGQDLRGLDLSGADLREASLEGALLAGTDLSGANLSRANLDESSFFPPRSVRGFEYIYEDKSRPAGSLRIFPLFKRQSYLKDALFQSTSFEKADLRWVKFENVTFRGNSFVGARFDRSTFLNSSIGAVRWDGATLNNVVFLNTYLDIESLENSTACGKSVIYRRGPDEDERKLKLKSCTAD